MPTYLVEFYVPSRATKRAGRVARPERNVQVIVVPEDETIFWLARTESLDELNLVLARRGVEPVRIVEATEPGIDRRRSDD